jgi:hypothetical protein
MNFCGRLSSNQRQGLLVTHMVCGLFDLEEATLLSGRQTDLVAEARKARESTNVFPYEETDSRVRIVHEAGLQGAFVIPGPIDWVCESKPGR